MRQPRVLLINPLVWQGWGVHQHLLRDWLAGESATSVVYPPLELAYAAAVVRALGGIPRILDASALHQRHGDVVREALRADPDFVVVPSTRFSESDDGRLLRMLRTALPGVRIVVSGYNVTRQPHEFAESTLVDFAIHGEIEIGLRNVLLEGGGANVAWRDEAGAVRVGPRTITADVDSLPLPARDLLPNARYRTHYTARNPFTLAITARGCGFRCGFCEIPVHGMGKIRFRSPRAVADELETLPAFGIREVMFRDGTFSFRRGHAAAICEEILRRRIDLAWKCMTSVNTVDLELLRLMKRAGCHLVSFGFETGNDRMLEQTGKGTTVEQGREAARLARAAGLETVGFFMFGLEGETEESARQTIVLAKELDVDYAQFIVYQPLEVEGRHGPGKPFERMDAEKATLRRTLVAGGLSADDLVRVTSRAYRSFYLRPHYWKKVWSKVHSLEDLALKIGAGMSLLWFAITRAALSRRALAPG